MRLKPGLWLNIPRWFICNLKSVGRRQMASLISKVPWKLRLGHGSLCALWPPNPSANLAIRPLLTPVPARDLAHTKRSGRVSCWNKGLQRAGNSLRCPLFLLCKCVLNLCWLICKIYLIYCPWIRFEMCKTVYRKLCISVPCPFLQPHLLPGSHCLSVFLPPQRFASSPNGPWSFALSPAWHGLLPLAGHSSPSLHLYLPLPPHPASLQGGLHSRLSAHKCHPVGLCVISFSTVS